MFHSPCCEWPYRLVKLGSARAGDVNPFQSPRARTFSMNLLNIGHQDMQWRCGVGCPVWILRANSCVFHPKQRASDTKCCGSQRHQNLSEHLREKRSTGSPAQPSAQLCYTRPTLPHLVPFYHLWVTLVLKRIGNPADCFFYSNCNSFGLVAQLSPWQQQSITDLQILQRWLLRVEHGWQHLPSETCTHQK